MNLYAYLTVFLLFIPLQASMLAPLSRIGLVPDLGLIIIATIGLLSGPIEGALAGVAFGLYQDISSASLIGLSGLNLGIVGFAAGFLGQRVLDVRGPSTAVLFALFSVMDSLLTTIYLEMTYDSFPILRQLFSRMLPRAFVTALAGYWLLQFVMRRNVLELIKRRELQKDF